MKRLFNFSCPVITCKYGNDEFKKHGLVPLELRFGIDSIPCELTRKSLYTYVSEEEAYLSRIQLIGPKKDVEKRICTIHPVFRVKGKQIILPSLIMRNKNRVDSNLIRYHLVS